MAKKNTAKEEVAVMRPGFLALADFNMDQTMAEELEGLEGGFDRVKIPAGGVTMFELPGDEADEPEGVKEFSAVILYHHPLQQYYATKYTGGSNPPDCGSFDGIMGEGEPGGVCANCPLNQFGSGENNSKACKNRRRVFLLREGELFPLILSLPTGSMKEFSRYIKRLLSKGRKSNSVVTRFSLKKATWSYVKKKYKLNVNSTLIFLIILFQFQVFSILSSIFSHVHSAIRNCNDYESLLYY